MNDGRTGQGLPEGAVAALDEWLEERTGSLLHAWVADVESTVLAVVATVGDEAFDSETDGYDVDSIELHLLTVFDSVQEGWSIESDGEYQLGAIFGELANKFVNGETGVLGGENSPEE